MEPVDEYGDPIPLEPVQPKVWKGRVKVKQKPGPNILIPIIILQTPQDLDTEQYHMLKPGKSYFRRESGTEQDWKPLSNLQLIDVKNQTYRVR